jgi:HEAT repeat protein
MSLRRSLRRPAAVFVAMALLGPIACAPANDPDRLLADLTSDDVEARQEAADKITGIVASNDYKVFVRGLASADPLRRAQSIVYLGEMTSPEARRALTGLLAVERRMLLPFNPVRMRPQSELADSRILVATLIQRTVPDPEAVGVLTRGDVSAQTPETIAGTCLAAGALRDPAAVPFLAKAARHPSPEVVRAAVQALGMFDTQEAEEALLGASTHPSPEVRADVVSALATRLDDSTRSIMMTMGREDASSEIRATALQSLSRFKGDDIVPYFIDRLGDAPEELRPVLQEILSRLTGQALGPKPQPWARWWASRSRAVASR